jgi:hypothetical protein
LARTRKEAEALVQEALAESFAQRFREEHARPKAQLWRALNKRWLWTKLRERLSGHQHICPARPVYWQEFVPGNDRDLRINVIGDRFAHGFWRRNRPGDFRASGSGLIMYDEVPEDAVRYCLELNKRCGFDSMGYDLLFGPNGFIVSEISYTYADWAVHNSPYYLRLEPDGSLGRVEKHVWPQHLIVEWALERWGALGGVPEAQITSGDAR